MKISHITEIKDDTHILFYRLGVNLPYILLGGELDRINDIATMVKESFDIHEGFELYYGSLAKREEETNCYLFIEQGETLRYEHGNWEDMYHFSSQNESIMSTIIPLYTTQIELKKEEPEMTKDAAKEIFTGAELISVAKEKELYETTSKPAVVISRDKNGVFFYKATDEAVVIDNEFLTEVFVRHVEPAKEPIEILTLEEAMKEFAKGKHVHANVKLPNGEIDEGVCLNQFLPIAIVIQEAQEAGPIELMQTMHEIKEALGRGDEDAIGLTNPINAAIPVEILVNGEFFIEDHESSNPFFK